MKTMNGEKLLEKLLNKYNKDTEDWTFQIGSLEYHFFDIYLTHGSKMWQIKIEMYTPNPISVGAKIGKVEHIIQEPSFGKRPLKIKDIINLSPREMFKKIKETKTIPLDELDGRGSLGPFGIRNLEIVSKKHGEINEKLKASLYKTIEREKCPFYG